MALHFLDKTKVDLPPEEMFRAYAEGTEGRRKVATYCLQDCVLVEELFHKLGVLTKLCELGNVSCSLPQEVHFRGELMRVYRLLCLEAPKGGYVVEDRPYDEDDATSGYQGASVLDPIPGYVEEPVLVLDFQSLYPSIIKRYNLCTTTLTSPEVPGALVPPGCGDAFVQTNVHRGLLPRILDDLLSRRKAVKKLLAKESDPATMRLLNSRQLALKVSSNSVYRVS